MSDFQTHLPEDDNYAFSTMSIDENVIHTHDGTIAGDSVPDAAPTCGSRLVGAPPLVERLYRSGLSDIESNIVQNDSGRRFFGAGDGFGARVYTRDISFAGILALNRLYPQLMRDSLEHSRDVRLGLGWTVGQGYETDAIDAPWKVEPVTEREFLKAHKTNNLMRRTDDVIWLWAAADLVDAGGWQESAEAWRWIYDTGIRCFDLIYQRMFDAATGLYRGQASFIDIHYVDHAATGYPEEWSVQDCYMGFATSTNALYSKGLAVMAEAARQVGEDARDWQGRRATHRAAMMRHLRRSDGTWRYLLSERGEPLPQREALGAALVVLLDVVETDADRKAALAGYPGSSRGIPVFTPQLPTDRCYHNHAVWPYVESLFLSAWQVASGRSTAGARMALCARSCIDDGSFHEMGDHRTGMIRTKNARQLWSAAAYLGAAAELFDVAPRPAAGVTA